MHLQAQPRLLAVSALLLNAAAWGLSWWPFRHLHGVGLHPLWVTSLVYLLAAVLITLWRPRAWSQLARSPALWVILLASGGTNAAFNWAVTVGEVTRVVLLFYLTPLWTVLLAWGLLGEQPTRAVLGRVALALGGAVLVISAGGGGATADGSTPVAVRHAADALGVFGGLCFALNNVMLRREAAQPEEGRALAMFAGGTLVAGLVAALCSAQVGFFGLAGIHWPTANLSQWWLPTLALALTFLVANLALQYGAARLPANVTAVVMPAEVPIATLSAMWIGGEAVLPAVWVGGALIVGATLLAAFDERR